MANREKAQLSDILYKDSRVASEKLDSKVSIWLVCRKITPLPINTMRSLLVVLIFLINGISPNYSCGEEVTDILDGHKKYLRNLGSFEYLVKDEMKRYMGDDLVTHRKAQGRVFSCFSQNGYYSFSDIIITNVKKSIDEHKLAMETPEFYAWSETPENIQVIWKDAANSEREIFNAIELSSRDVCRQMYGFDSGLFSLDKWTSKMSGSLKPIVSSKQNLHLDLYDPLLSEATPELGAVFEKTSAGEFRVLSLILNNPSKGFRLREMTVAYSGEVKIPHSVETTVYSPQDGKLILSRQTSASDIKVGNKGPSFFVLEEFASHLGGDIISAQFMNKDGYRLMVYDDGKFISEEDYSNKVRQALQSKPPTSDSDVVTILPIQDKPKSIIKKPRSYSGYMIISGVVLVVVALFFKIRRLRR